MGEKRLLFPITGDNPGEKWTQKGIVFPRINFFPDFPIFFDFSTDLYTTHFPAYIRYDACVLHKSPDERFPPCPLVVHTGPTRLREAPAQDTLPLPWPETISRGGSLRQQMLSPYPQALQRKRYRDIQIKNIGLTFFPYPYF